MLSEPESSGIHPMSRHLNGTGTGNRPDAPELDPLPASSPLDAVTGWTHTNGSPAVPVKGSRIPVNGNPMDDPQQNGHAGSRVEMNPDAMRNVQKEYNLYARQTTANWAPNAMHTSHAGAAQDGSVEPLAIVGMAFEFPDGAVTDDSFWDMLTEKRCASSEFPVDRINIDAFHNADQKPGSIHTRKAHFLKDDIYNFDASFFSVSAADAAAMDPLQRRLMETTYHALENAGMTLSSVSASNTSVHVGCFSNDYMTFAFRDAQRIPKYAATGCSQAILSNRISWFFNLRGPSMTIDTACSSGLVALDLACQGLWNGTSDMAIVAGANLILSPEFNISLSHMNFLSKDGKCFSFDHRANGYARGEGFAVFIVKPLRKAHGDNIRAVIRSVGSNQDGRTAGGITQPSRDMQSRLIRETYRKANLDMSKTRFFEAHGTGTSIGDPTEASAIGECFGAYRDKENPLYVGALKSNIGHLEGTSGLAGVVKAVLALEKGTIPPNTNFETLNPDIDAEFFNLAFPQASVPWPSCDVRRASVNSFGFGGANAHVVLDDAESHARSRRSRVRRSIVPSTPIEKAPFKPSLLVFSAAHEAGVEEQAKVHSRYLREGQISSPSRFVCDYTYTLAVHRTRLPWASFCVLESPTQLRDLGSIMSQPTTKLGLEQNLGLVFTGQGAQWQGMGQELLTNATFRRSISSLQNDLADLGCTWSLIDHFEGRIAVSVDEAQYSQVLTTALQIALVDLVYAVGVTPSVVVGHSSGEIAAAYAAGHISAAAAIKISYYRGLLGSTLESSAGGRYGMAAVGLSREQMEAELEHWSGDSCHSDIGRGICISCINSPSSVTVSGPEAQLNELIPRLQDRQIFARKLKVKLAYHSPQMSRISAEYLILMGALEPGTPKEKAPVMVSSVTSDIVTRETTCSGKYWVRNMVSAVNFLGAMELCNRFSNNSPTVKRLDRSHKLELRTHGWLEIGPHSALQGPIRQILKSSSRDKEVTYTPTLIRNSPAFTSLLSAAGRLYCQGFSMNLEKVTTLGLSAEEIESRNMLFDVPPYPFDHSIQHREEAPSNKAFRLRSHGKHDLLGSQLGDPNPNESQWSFTIKEDDMPWVRDHKVNGSILYPAAGMLVMAIEAAKQTLDVIPLAFELEDVSFIAPIMIPSGGDGVEVRTHLSSAPRGGKGEFGYRFRIFLYKPGKEPETVCTGTLREDLGFVRSEVDHGKEQDEASSQIRREYESLTPECCHVVGHTEMYQNLRDTTGLDYGPEFQPLHDVKVSMKGQAVAVLAPHDLANTSPCTVHPSRLDGIFQMCFAAMAGTEGLSTFIPSHVQRMWIPSAGFGHRNASQEREKVYATAKSIGKRIALFDITAVDGSDLSLKARISGLELTAVSSNAESRKTLAEAKHLCSHMVWKVDLDTLETDEIQTYCEEARAAGSESTQWWNDLAEIAFQFGLQALKQVQDANGVVAPSMEQYVDWLRQQIASRADPSEISPEALDELCTRVLPSPRAESHITIGRQLSRILCGDVDPLQVLFADEGKMTDFYLESMNDSSNLGPLGRYLDCLTHKSPNLRFLEIGAGTGSMTTTVLSLVEDGETGLPFQDYVFTDISPSFFDKARETFGDHKRITFQTLDIEHDPINQGFDEENYDVILADNVLHATQDLVSTLRNIRRLLKPGGRLIFKELTTPRRLLTGFIFGLLPGWWRASEKERRLSPCVTESSWNDLLRQAGFSGTDIIFPDHHVDVCHQWSFLVATALEDSTVPSTISENSLDSPIFIIDTSSEAQLALSNAISAKLDLAGPPVVSSIGEATFLAAQKPHTCHFIVLYEVESAFMKEIQPDDFNSLTKLLQSARSILWVRQGGRGNSLSTPDFGLIDGLFRVNRNENSNVSLAILALEDADSQKSAGNIAKVHKTTQKSIVSKTVDFEPEWSEGGNRLHISRLREARHLNEHVLKRVAQPVVHEQLNSKELKLGIRAPGLLDTLEWSEVHTLNEPIGPDAIDVDVRAVGINFKDCLTLLGRTKTEDLGSEYSGIVRNVGASITEFKVGDRVALGALNSFKSRLRVHKNNVVRIPEGMSFIEAAAVPTAYCTAYYTLIEVARLRKGETVLIHAAAGGTGQAAIQTAKYIGAEIYATVGSYAKKKLLMDTYDIPEDHILYSRDTSFALGIKRMTNGTGVDVILNSVSGRLLEATWSCIAPFGRFVEIGLRDIISGGQLPMDVFTRGVSFSSVDLSLVVKRKDDISKRVITEVFKLFENGHLTVPRPLQVYSVDKAEEAFRFLQSGKSSGKLVLEVNPDVVLPVVQGSHSDFSLDANATYVVSGGLGGIGRSIAKWLVVRGARNLILLSRSGVKGHSKAEELLAELSAMGANVQCPACDITDPPSLRSVISEYAESMPKIKGCIQAAMVLQDATISTMTMEEWNHVVKPKVEGSWNLHAALPSGLDFFILLSSCCGIFGNGGQANYAAGNTYQDALAKYRATLGENAVSLDLGYVLGEGFVAENQHIMDRLSRLDLLHPNSLAEIFAMLDHYCQPSIQVPVLHSQVITGLRLPADIIADGKDVPAVLQNPLFRHMHQAKYSSGKAATPDSRLTTIISEFTKASSAAEAALIVSEALKEKLSRVLGMKLEQIKFDHSLSSYGVDSLVGLELRNWLARETGADLAVFELLSGATLKDIGEAVASRTPTRPEAWKE